MDGYFGTWLLAAISWKVEVEENEQQSDQSFKIRSKLVTVHCDLNIYCSLNSTL